MPQKTGLLFMVFSGQMGENELGNQKPFYIKKKTCLSSLFEYMQKTQHQKNSYYLAFTLSLCSHNI